jgi:hypothetical protein
MNYSLELFSFNRQELHKTFEINIMNERNILFCFLLFFHSIRRFRKKT